MKDDLLMRVLTGIQKEGEKIGLTYDEIVRLKSRVLAITAVEEEREEMNDIAMRG